MLFIYCSLISQLLARYLLLSFLPGLFLSILVYLLICKILSLLFSVEISTTDSAFVDPCSNKSHPFLLGCCVLEEPIDVSSVRKTLEKGLKLSHYYDKLKKTLRSFMKIEYWSPVKDFNLDDHLEKVGGISNRDELCHFMSLQASIGGIDPEKPQWKLFVIERYMDSKAALILKIDHTYGDGLSVMSFFLNTGKAENVRFVSLPKFNKFLIYLLFPLGILKSLIWAFNLVKERRDHNKFCENKVTGNLHAYCSNPLDLKLCKEYSKARGVSINELLLTLMIKNFQNYHQTKFNEPLTEFKIFIASSLRSIAPKLEFIPLANSSNFVVLDKLPSPETGFEACLKKVRETAGYLLKGSLDFYYRGVATQLSYLTMPKNFNLMLTRTLCKKISCVFTNVPGPLEKIKFYDKAVSDFFFFTGGMNDACLITTIMSYGGKFYFSCSADDSYLIDVKELIRGFESLVSKEIIDKKFT